MNTTPSKPFPWWIPSRQSSALVEEEGEDRMNCMPIALTMPKRKYDDR
jgi:hypothetical protein